MADETKETKDEQPQPEVNIEMEPPANEGES